MKILYVWPDGAWCWPDEVCEMSHKSDDYRSIEVSDSCDDEDAERIADLEADRGYL